MLSRYIISTTPSAIESKFALPPQSILVENNYNISPGQLAPVITNEKPYEIQLFQFGLTPFWAKREMLIGNARSEGDYNKEDYPDFKGAKGIILKPAFRKPIRSQRCLVIASAFIEGVKESRLSIPYLVYLRNHKNPFAIAGIWDTWLNPQTGDSVNSFCIITTSANSLMQKLGHLRMPVILSDNEEKRWIKPTAELTNITCLLNRYDSKLMNAYPIDPKIKNPINNDKQLIQPVGAKVLTEDESQVFQCTSYQGYYRSKKRPEFDDTKPSWGEISSKR
jgi:putative SOS response-associated peptidase YedK